MLKQIRILADGTIADPDRRVHVTGDPSKGGPDQVQWLAPGGSDFRIDFAYIKGTPLDSGIRTFDIPPSNPHRVSQNKGEYKYDVYKKDAKGDWQKTDDPDVVID